MPSSRGSLPSQISEPFASRDTSLLPKYAVRAFVETNRVNDPGHSDFNETGKKGHGSSWDIWTPATFAC